MSILIRSLLFFVLFGSGVAGATSELPLFDQCIVAALPGTNYMTPSHAGERLDGSDASDDMTIQVTMICSTGPCAGLPFQDIYIQGPAESNLAFCLGGNMASMNTNGQGLTHFWTPLGGGGWTVGGVRVYYAGSPLPDSIPGDFRINSPDINGDLLVNMLDVATFAMDYNSGYHFRSDFVADGVLDLLDVGRLAIALGDACL